MCYPARLAAGVSEVNAVGAGLAVLGRWEPNPTVLPHV
jgi:hypothetical protein